MRSTNILGKESQEIVLLLHTPHTDYAHMDPGADFDPHRHYNGTHFPHPPTPNPKDSPTLVSALVGGVWQYGGLHRKKQREILPGWPNPIIVVPYPRLCTEGLWISNGRSHNKTRL